MASFLTEFNARLATYVDELEKMQTRNKQEHTFSPSFWLEHADFTLARDVFVAVRAPMHGRDELICCIGMSAIVADTLNCYVYVCYARLADPLATR